MINNQKIFLECYKTSITVDFDRIYAPVEYLYVTLKEAIIKKFLLDIKGKMKYLIIFVYNGGYGP